jgi:allantoinase
MSLDPNYLRYDRRRQGMDQDRYVPRTMQQVRVQWPEEKPLAVLINLTLEHFPLDAKGEGFKAPGSMQTPYPDLRHYTLRDYGNRVGVYRVLDALEKFQMPASVCVNGELAQRYPALMRDLSALDIEWIAHGWNMDHVHFGGVDEQREREWITQTRDALLPFAKTLNGWMSPARSQSERTPELIKQAGFNYCCDWVNDELPYSFATANGELTMLPFSIELEDRFILGENFHSEQSYAEQVSDALDQLLAEAIRENSGRLLTLNIHPWIIGAAHRIRYFEQILARLQPKLSQLWLPCPSSLIVHWQAQTIEPNIR